MDSKEKNCALLEAIFLMETEPQDEDAIKRISGLNAEELTEALEALEARCSTEESGVQLVRSGGGYQLFPKKEFWEILKDRYGKKNEERLSRAAMETLSIIAYSQPVTRAEIKDIRGVDPDNMIRYLDSRNLIKEVGKKDVPGKPVQYGTTKDFLQAFRLGSIADLPKMEKDEAERFELDGEF